MEGTVYDVAALSELAKIPSREDCFQDYLEVCSHQLQTSLALSNRSQKKMAKQLQRQLKLLQSEAAETTASNWNYILYPAGYAFMG